MPRNAYPPFGSERGSDHPRFGYRPVVSGWWPTYLSYMAEQLMDAVPRTYEAAVRTLADAHAAGDPGMDIYAVPDPQQRVVRLIEVSDAFPEGGVDRPVPPDGVERIVPVFPMGPARDFPFRSEVVQVTRAEWDQIRQQQLQLNRDWGDLGLAARIQRGQ
jgi:hypothetical protein